MRVITVGNREQKMNAILCHNGSMRQRWSRNGALSVKATEVSDVAEGRRIGTTLHISLAPTPQRSGVKL